MKPLIPVFTISLLLIFGEQMTVGQPGNKESAEPEVRVLNLDSEILGEKRQVYISLPAGYNDSTAYPVIMIMEAEILFETIAPLTRLMSSVGEIPECVLVGIPLNDRHPDFSPVLGDYPESGNADRMLEHFKTELFPMLESEYHCSQERIIWAHSGLAGIFCTYLLLGPDRQFSGIIASSPNLRFVEKDYLMKENPFEELARKGKRFFYLTFGGEEADVYMESLAPKVGEFADRLEIEAPDNLIWEYRYNENNTHFTNALETYMEGVISYFMEMH